MNVGDGKKSSEDPSPQVQSEIGEGSAATYVVKNMFIEPAEVDVEMASARAFAARFCSEQPHRSFQESNSISMGSAAPGYGVSVSEPTPMCNTMPGHGVEGASSTGD